jgi:hypothetical protein
MPAAQHYIVGSSTVYRNDDGSYLCDCMLFRKAQTCGHLQAVQKKLGEVAKPKAVVPSPLPASPSVHAVRGAQFGTRKIRKD